MKKHYLIDFENVHEDGLTSIDASSEDTIYLFYTQNAAKIGLDALSEITARICVIKVAAGKQSLDMHLSSYLGYLLWKYGKEDSYIVVSNDTDFDGVIKHWKNEHGFSNITRLGTNMKPVKEDVQVQDENKVNQKIVSLLTADGVDPNIVSAVSALVSKFAGDENHKQETYRALIKKYGQKNGLRYYNIIKKEV